MAQHQMQKASPDKFNALKLFVAEHRGRFDSIIPSNAKMFLTPDQCARAIVMAAKKMPKLLDCSPVSILNAACQAVQYGLEPGGPLGHAALVPYGEECTFQFQYKGLVVLAKRHGCIEKVEADVAFEGEHWRFRRLLRSTEFEHEPTGHSGTLRAAYAIATLPGEVEPVIAVAWPSELDQARKLSRSPSWDNWPNEMRKKFVVKRALKLLDLTQEVAEAIAADNEIDGEPEHVIDVPTTTAKPTRTQALAQRIGSERKVSVKTEKGEEVGPDFDQSPPKGVDEFGDLPVSMGGAPAKPAQRQPGDEG